MSPFCWPSIQQDLALAREVAARKPEKKTSDWDAVALALSEAFSTDEKVITLKARGCRERMERLLLKYRTENAKGFKRYIDRGKSENVYPEQAFHIPSFLALDSNCGEID